jgi:hypothetical protein
MRIYLIVGQRKERYLGEYLPEVLDVIDEFGNDEDPYAWIEDRIRELRYPDRAQSEFEAVASIAIEVPQSAIMKRLRPSGVVESKVVED